MSRRIRSVWTVLALALLLGIVVSCGPDLTWTIYTRSDNIGSNEIRDVFIDREGLVWVGTAGGQGASVYDGETWTLFTVEDGLVWHQANDVYVDDSGAAWFATEQGLSRYDGST